MLLHTHSLNTIVLCHVTFNAPSAARAHLILLTDTVPSQKPLCVHFFHVLYLHKPKMSQKCSDNRARLKKRFEKILLQVSVLKTPVEAINQAFHTHGAE